MCMSTMVTLASLWACNELGQLKRLLANCNTDEVRALLLKEFQRLACYRNVADWNHAVRLCEALAIIGWGNHEPVEAIRGVFFNGNPMTGFRNRFGEFRFVEAIWSKRKAGLTMENHRTSYYASPDCPGKPTVLSEYPILEEIQPGPLCTQRNWIAKNPIQLRRVIANCYESTQPLADAIEDELAPRLDREMQPERYGEALQHLLVRISFSYFDNDHCKCNIITFDEQKPLGKDELRRRLATLYSSQEIKQMGYFSRNKFEYGNFQAATATMAVVIHFSKDFSAASLNEQRAVFRSDLDKAITTAATKLAKKRLAYDFARMTEDFERILASWCDG
jgi:hypothetical protein